MDILFIYPPISVSKKIRQKWGQLPVAICHPWELLSPPHLSEKGFKVGLIDGVIEDLSIDQMVEKVLELNPKS